MEVDVHHWVCGPQVLCLRAETNKGRDWLRRNLGHIPINAVQGDRGQWQVALQHAPAFIRAMRYGGLFTEEVLH